MIPGDGNTNSPPVDPASRVDLEPPADLEPPVDAEPPVNTVSLRRRVVLSVLALLTVLLVLLGVVISTVLGNALRADLRQRLADNAGYAVVLQQQGVTGQTLADQMSTGGLFSTFTANGEQFVGSPQAPPEPPVGPSGNPPADGPAGGPVLPQPAVEPDVRFTESNGQLVAEITLADGTLQLQASEAEIDRTLSVLRTIELIAGGTALIITGAVLIRVVAVALRPLERMTSLARKISAGARGRRLRPTRPDTEIGRTAVAFDHMLDDLEAAESVAQQAEERMRLFLADASHDLRTPLAGVIVGADALLRADFDAMDRTEREERLVVIVRQARHAARLVDDLLLMTRLDAGSRQLSRVDLIEVVREQLTTVTVRRPDVVVRLTGTPRSVVVEADQDGLRRAIANLLANAADASPPGGEVTVFYEVTGDGIETIDCAVTGGSAVTIGSAGTVDCAETAIAKPAPLPGSGHDNGTARLSVLDEGPGVPAADRNRIFDRFVRLTPERGGLGSGLGLPIARAVARQEGGDVTCNDRTDRPGGRFDLTLPLGRTGTIGTVPRHQQNDYSTTVTS